MLPTYLTSTRHVHPIKTIYKYLDLLKEPHPSKKTPIDSTSRRFSRWEKPHLQQIQEYRLSNSQTSRLIWQAICRLRLGQHQGVCFKLSPRENEYPLVN